MLYVWGTLVERDHHAISVVGSRKASHYGLDCAKKLSYQLAYAGLTVVSGLARGIDTAAHQGALAAQGRTIAVIGSGLMDLYPAENQALAEKIAASGAVVSRIPDDLSAEPADFSLPQPHRRRLGQRAGRRRGRTEQRRADHRRARPSNTGGWSMPFPARSTAPPRPARIASSSKAPS